MTGLLGLSIAAATANNLLIHGFSLARRQALFFFNFLCGCVWILMLLPFCLGDLAFTANEITFGLLWGVTQAAFLFCKSGAMSSGLVSVTTLIGNASLLFSTIAGVILFRETVGVAQYIGVPLLLLAVFLCTFRGFSGGQILRRWIPFCAGFLVTAAAIGIIFKYFSACGGGNVNRMMLIGALTVTLCMAAETALTRGFSFAGFGEGKCLPLRILGCGAVSCLYNRLNITLAGALPSAFFFPAFNGGVILLCALCGRFLFGEKLSARAWVGIGLGVVAIVIIGML